jgi:putative transport protein
MVEWLTPFMEKNPEVAVFLAIGLGYWIGNWKIRGVGIGPVTGSLLAGVLVGYFWKVPVSDTAKQLLFLMFMYGIGYSAGPGFVRGVREGGWRWVAVGVFLPVMGLATAYVMARVLQLELGYAAGMMSGGLTESPVIGTASEAIRALPIPEEEQHRLITQIPVADALCYLFGTVGLILFCSHVGPALLRVDLQAEARKLEAEMGIEHEEKGVSSAWHMFELRAYELVPDGPAVGRTIGQVENAVAEERIFIERIRRGGEIVPVKTELVLQPGDVVGAIGHHEALLRVLGERRREVFDRELLDVPTATFDIVLTNKKLSGRTLEDIARTEVQFRGVFLKSLKRDGEQIPIARGTQVFRGDLLTIHGLEPAVRRVAASLGDVLQQHGTDYIAMGLAICVGALLGLVIAFHVGSVRVALGSSVATLLLGLAMGWRNSVRPNFAILAPDAIDLMKSVGLAGFVAMIGLKAGPIFVQALREVGLSVFLGGVVVTLTPLVTTLFFGRYVLKLNPLLLLGALAGAQTMTAGLAAVQERSGSPVAVIGYSSTVAFGHVLISVGGTALIWMLHAS